MSPTESQPVEEITAFVKRAVTEDVPLYRVISDVERAILVAARQRHPTWHHVQLALKIPRTSLSRKRQAHFLE